VLMALVSLAVSKLMGRPTGRIAVSRKETWPGTDIDAVRQELSRRLDEAHFVDENPSETEIVAGRAGVRNIVEGHAISSLDSLSLGVRISLEPSSVGVVVHTTVKSKDIIIWGVDEAAYLRRMASRFSAADLDRVEKQQVQHSRYSWWHIMTLMIQATIFLASARISDASVSAGLAMATLVLAFVGHRYARLSVIERRMKGEPPEALKKWRWISAYGWCILALAGLIWVQRFVLPPLH
jgi:hypothetical protein